MKRTCGLVLALAFVGGAFAAKTEVNPVAGMLTKAQVEEGWIALFDGKTDFGWKIEGESKVADGALVLGGEKATTAETTTRFGNYELKIEVSGAKDAQIVLDGKPQPIGGGSDTVQAKVDRAAKPSPVGFKVPAGKTVRITKVLLKPEGMKSIFNGKDLAGWTPIEGKQSVYAVKDGAINITNGGGELQSEWTGDNFILQLDVISNGKNLNSGIFFRALRGQFWQGYEAQIRNEWDGYSKDEKRNAAPEDRGKPVDIGTGGLYNRQPTRRVVSSDGEWLTMTLVADEAHFATWVNGYQCTDFVDTKPDAPTARKGRYLGKGCLGLQGHDPTTDLSFKNIRVADLPKGEAK